MVWYDLVWLVWYGIWLCGMESVALATRLRCVALRCVTVLDRRRPGVVRGEVHTEGSVAGGRWSVVGGRGRRSRRVVRFLL